MKKIAISLVVIVIFAIYAIFYHKSTDATVTSTQNSQPSSNTNTSKKTTSSNGETYKDGSYTGSAADAYYGTIQVKAIIQSGKISDVQFLQYPNDQQESIEVNQAAMPNLKQEAIQAQNANVDIVSGATQTSQAFKQSLASALSQAK